MIKIGPSGIGGKNDAKDNLKFYSENKIKAAEVAFTYSVYLKKKDAIEIGNYAKKLNIDLTVHASYYVNLSSEDSKKIEQSKKRILESCERANDLQAKKVIFHPGFFGKKDEEEVYLNIKKEILFLQNYIKKKKWNVELAPETTGKINVFGSLDEILKLSKETNCSFCIDFAHLKARNKGNINYKEVIKKLKNHKNIHCHYSGIEYGEKGEKHHKSIELEEFKSLLKELKKSAANYTIICESPNPIKDSIKMINSL